MDPNEAEHRLHVGDRAVKLAEQRKRERAGRTKADRNELERRIENGEKKIEDVERAEGFEPPRGTPPSYADRT